jgi:hypothetical protein
MRGDAEVCFKTHQEEQGEPNKDARPAAGVLAVDIFAERLNERENHQDEAPGVLWSPEDQPW